MERNVARKDTGLGRLSEPALLVLAALAAGSKHGYAIIHDIEVHSGQRLGPGTLYGVIHRLLESKWIERFETDDTSRDKRPYRLTSLGRKFLQAELARMKQLTRAATTCLKPKEA